MRSWRASRGHLLSTMSSNAICDKLTRRHPHVFGGIPVADAAEQSRVWETLKAEERKAQGQGSGALAGIPMALPALSRARKLGRRAADAGFDWPDAAGHAPRSTRSLANSTASSATAGTPPAWRRNSGTCCSPSSTWRAISTSTPETALRRANERFERRYAHLEQALAARGIAPATAGPELLDRLWAAAKAEIP